jgi:cytochrome c6
MRGAGNIHARRIGMLRRMAKLSLLLVVSTVAVAGCSKDEQQKVTVAPAASAPNSREPVPDGEALFRQNCAACHPNGGNVSDPERSLYGSVLRRKHITRPEDIIRIMRKPLSRMIRFDAATLPDEDARVIAEYVLKTFK